MRATFPGDLRIPAEFFSEDFFPHRCGVKTDILSQIFPQIEISLQYVCRTLIGLLHCKKIAFFYLFTFVDDRFRRDQTVFFF